MKIFKHIFLPFILAVILSSCGTTMMTTKLNSKQYPVDQVIKNENLEKNSKNIKVNVVNKSSFPVETTVLKNKILWLWFYAIYDYDILLGNKSMNKNLDNHYSAQLSKSIEGMTPFNINNSNFDYDLTVNILECKTQSNYKCEIIVGQYVYTVKAAETKLISNIELRLPDSSTFTKEFTNTLTTPFIKDRVANRNKLLNNMMLNMTENLSVCIRNNIYNIVNELNRKTKTD